MCLGNALFTAMLIIHQLKNAIIWPTVLLCDVGDVALVRPNESCEALHNKLSGLGGVSSTNAITRNMQSLVRWTSCTECDALSDCLRSNLCAPIQIISFNCLWSRMESCVYSMSRGGAIGHCRALGMGECECSHAEVRIICMCIRNPFGSIFTSSP